MNSRFIVISIFTLLTMNIQGQDLTNSTRTYIHDSPASFRSKMVKSVMSAVGMKKFIGKQIKKESFSQEAAALPKSLQKRYDVEVSEKDGRKIWTIKPKENASEKVILFLHGGAYILNITKYHWMLIEELLVKTNATIVVPDYPLAPGSAATGTYRFMDLVYTELCKDVSPANIILMGDSAGGGLALGFAQKLRDESLPRPSRVILLSPWLDITMTHPGIKEVDRSDKVLGIEGLQLAGRAYAGDTDPKDYRVSPIYGTFSGLGEISIFIGTHDLFIADSRKFKGIMEENNLPLNYFEYPEMFHDWIIVTSLEESRHAIEQISLLITRDN